ncbi:MFS transporter [Parachitinimonas caeni]|uniref:MFS transporter n=1 Tax=Parachitinimonas caeni TaxID=3031301 RepID=A0ABT7E090_9NEIS|nr:MFS transporter [Parachitinimonas caeni]MDK2125731.1 MFS transporter [Parachitinimonas caeni]
MTPPRLLLWPLCGFYFFYFAYSGFYTPYWSLYLTHRGFDGVAIGSLLALVQATRVVSPGLWGWLADHSGDRRSITLITSILATLIFAWVFAGESYSAFALIMVGAGFFWAAALPLVEATTLSLFAGNAAKYTKVRVWGSWGFAVTNLIGGAWIGWQGVQHLPWLILLTLLGIIAFAWWLPATAVSGAGKTSGGPDLERPSLISIAALFAASALITASHGTYYGFYTLQLKAHDYSGMAIGLMWGLGVLAEIGVFTHMSKLTSRFHLKNLLLACFAIAVARFLLIGWMADNFALLLLAQIGHAATFAVTHAVTMVYVHRFFAGHLQARGQGLYVAIVHGMGGVVGSLAGGWLWQHTNPSWTFTGAAAFSLFGGLIIASCLRR